MKHADNENSVIDNSVEHHMLRVFQPAQAR
jgi:hypothetical protein